MLSIFVTGPFNVRLLSENMSRLTLVTIFLITAAITQVSPSSSSSSTSAPDTPQLCAVVAQQETLDVGSRTILASNVFEARADRVAINVTTSTDDDDVDVTPRHRYAVVFRVRTVFKGVMDKRDPPKDGSISTSTEVYKLVTVGWFDDFPLRDYRDRVDSNGGVEGGCVTGGVKLGAVYIVFVYNKTWLASPAGTGKKPTPFYEISAAPELATDSVRQTVRDFSCAKCVRAPKVAISTEHLVVTTNQRLQLSCRATGQPTPTVTWLKDGQPLNIHSRVQIKENQRGGSRLRISRVDSSDSGMYQCQATSIVGISRPSPEAWVSVVPAITTMPPTKPHARPCGANLQSYCLNGGICYVLTSLDITFCQCTISFQGERCQEKYTGFPELASYGDGGIVDEGYIAPVNFQLILSIAALALSTLSILAIWAFSCHAHRFSRISSTRHSRRGANHDNFMNKCNYPTASLFSVHIPGGHDKKLNTIAVHQEHDNESFTAQFREDNDIDPFSVESAGSPEPPFSRNRPSIVVQQQKKQQRQRQQQQNQQQQQQQQMQPQNQLHKQQQINLGKLVQQPDTLQSRDTSQSRDTPLSRDCLSCPGHLEVTSSRQRLQAVSASSVDSEN